MIWRSFWILLIGFLYWVMWSKGGYDSGAQAWITLVVGFLIGVLLSLAAQTPRTTNAARRKFIYWPLALIVFWIYPLTMDRATGSGLLLGFLISGSVGLVFGTLHFAISSRQLRKAGVV